MKKESNTKSFVLRVDAETMADFAARLTEYAQANRKDDAGE